MNYRDRFPVNSILSSKVDPFLVSSTMIVASVSLAFLSIVFGIVAAASAALLVCLPVSYLIYRFLRTNCVRATVTVRNRQNESR
jgi:hypothetical protein